MTFQCQHPGCPHTVETQDVTPMETVHDSVVEGAGGGGLAYLTCPDGHMYGYEIPAGS